MLTGSNPALSSETSPAGSEVPLLTPGRRKQREGEISRRVEGGGDAGRIAPKTEQAAAFLRHRLRNGARVLSRELKREAAAAGISEKALRSARQRLGIRPEVEGSLGKDRRTYWSLPEGRWSMSDACPECGYRHGPQEQHRLATDFLPQRQRHASATAPAKQAVAHTATLLPPCELCGCRHRGRCEDVTSEEMIATILGAGWRSKQALRQARWRKAHPERHRQQQHYYRLKTQAKGDQITGRVSNAKVQFWDR